MNGESKVSNLSILRDKASVKVYSIITAVFLILLVLLGLETLLRPPAGGERIGTAARITGVTDRRQSGSPWYSDLDSSNAVFEGDLIRTGSESAATIELRNGVVISMRADTLVILHLKDSGVHVELLSGSARVSMNPADQEGEITHKKDSFRFRGEAEAKVEKESLLAWLVEGKGLLKSSGGSRELAAGQALRVQEGAIKEETSAAPDPMPAVPVKLYLPLNGHTFEYPSKGALAVFSWSRLSPGRTHALVISKNADLSSPVLQKRITVSTTGAFLEAGTYYWKVSQSSGAAGSEVRTFVVRKLDKPPAPVSYRPPANQVIDAEKLATEGEVFNWRADLDTVTSELSIAKDGDFGKAQVKLNTNSNFVNVVADLEPGEYQWRVQSTTSDGKTSEASQPRTVVIVRGGPMEALAPLPGSTVDMAGREDLAFKWKARAGANSYKFRLYQIQNGQAVLSDEAVVNGTEYVLKDLTKLDIGGFRWTVEPVLPGGERSKQSVDFKITLDEAKDKTRIVQ